MKPGYWFNFGFGAIFVQRDGQTEYHYDDDGMIKEISDEMRKYADDCFELFKEVWNTEVECDESDLTLSCTICDSFWNLSRVNGLNSTKRNKLNSDLLVGEKGRLNS